ARERSGQVDLDRGAVHAHGIDGYFHARGDPAGPGGQLEIVAVPRTDDRVTLEPALGEGSVFMRARRAGGIEATAAGVEDGDRRASVLEQRALADADLVDLHDLHVGHQRRSWSAWSMIERNSSMLVAPITIRPLIK